MTVAHILAAKGAELFTAHPELTLQEVAAKLTDNRVGALVVLDSRDQVVGLVAERDIVAAIARAGVQALQDEVKLHMDLDFKSVAEQGGIDEAMEIMTESRCRHLPVLRRGRLVGLISIGDVVKHRIERIESERLALHEYIAKA
jgi:CBS domain-containing protein